MLTVSKIRCIFFENIIKKSFVALENKEFTCKSRFVINLYLTAIIVRIKINMDVTLVHINFFDVFIMNMR